MEIKKIQDADLDGKKVLVRVDFNVAMEKGEIKEKFKIEVAKETIDYLLKKNCKIALISHLGRPSVAKALAGKPEGKADPKFSLGQIKDVVSESLGVRVNFIDDCIGDKVKEALENISSGEILLLENVRFYPGDEENSPEFSKELTEGFDIFINDAFSASHRNHASVTGVAKFLPSFAGFQLQKEIMEMEKKILPGRQ